MIAMKIKKTLSFSLFSRSLKSTFQLINKGQVAAESSEAILENRGGGRPSEEYEIQEIK